MGYRPVATLEGHDLEPYEHEWLRPIPLFIRGVGVAYGPYHELIERTLVVLQETSGWILSAAQFDLSRLDELALDPRAYDFDHPVNTRPNYYFGQWDPHRIDGSGYYRRFVLQQVTVDALMARVRHGGGLSRDELLTEAAAVLAGTILMASGICGASPNSIASTTTIMELLSHVAAYRDAFYVEYLPKLKGVHGQRLEAESKIRRQPLGGARQELNTTLGRLRAAQVERIQVARIFARMGSANAAKESWSANEARIFIESLALSASKVLAFVPGFSLCKLEECIVGGDGLWGWVKGASYGCAVQGTPFADPDPGSRRSKK